MQLLALSIPLQIIAFAFLLIATITVPVVDQLSLANNVDGANIGIFGYCVEETCSTPSLHTDFADVVSSSLLSDSVLNTLNSYLILCPISAGLTLFSIIFSVATLIFYKRKPTPTLFWIAAISMAVFAFLTSAAFCVIVFLMFYPHITWLTWCLIPSALLNFATLVLISVNLKLVPSPSEIVSDDEVDYVGVSNENKNQFDFDTPNPPTFRTQIDLPLTKSDSFVQIQNVYESSFNSSFSTAKKVNNDAVATVITTPHQDSPVLKIPDVSNPYNADPQSGSDSKSYILSTEIMSDYGDVENDNDPEALQSLHRENFSSNSISSNFTSISQRPINPQYYAMGHPNSSVQREPLGVNVSGNTNQQRYGGNGHQQVQINQFQQQMAGIPMKNKASYMTKPKPFMMMMGNNNAGPPNNMNGRQNHQNQNHIQYSQNFGNRNQNFGNGGGFQPQFNNNNTRYGNNNQFYPQNMNPAMGNRPSNGIAPMRYKGRSNQPQIPPSAMGNDGPYSGFR